MSTDGGNKFGQLPPNVAMQVMKERHQNRVLYRIVLEVRADRKIYVLPQEELDPREPAHMSIILGMLSQGITALSNKWIPEYERKLVEGIEKPPIEVVKG